MDVQLARFATIHWVRYAQVMASEALEPGAAPADCLSWKIGSDGPPGPDGSRMPSEIVCAVGLFRDEAAARNALATRAGFLPQLDSALENWNVALLAIANRGECNHLVPGKPGPMFECAVPDPGGPLVAITSAGFDPGPDFDPARVVDFRIHVGRVREWMRAKPGLVVHQTFTPWTLGDDGVTMSVWADDAAMTSVMYPPGAHRAQIDRYRAERTADRTWFSRLRALETCGSWNGIDPVEKAREMAAAA